MGSLPDHHARGTLNYLLDSLFWAKLSGLETAMPEKDLAAMLHFNLGSGIKTVEGSYYHCNSMLFILRDRVVEYLAVRELGLVPAFYKSVTEARDLCRRYGGFSEEGPPPVSELPNAAQLARYEAAFVRLETLATKGYLPAAVPVPEPVPVAPLAVPTSTPATVPAHARPSPAKRDAEAIFLRWWWWLVPGLLAAGGVALLWVKHRRRR